MTPLQELEKEAKETWSKILSAAKSGTKWEELGKSELLEEYIQKRRRVDALKKRCEKQNDDGLNTVILLLFAAIVMLYIHLR